MKTRKVIATLACVAALTVALMPAISAYAEEVNPSVPATPNAASEEPKEHTIIVEYKLGDEVVKTDKITGNIGDKVQLEDFEVDGVKYVIKGEREFTFERNLVAISRQVAKADTPAPVDNPTPSTGENNTSAVVADATANDGITAVPNTSDVLPFAAGAVALVGSAFAVAGLKLRKNQ